jgi:hypothetical protein
MAKVRATEAQCRVILFLDFDGVVHPVGCSRESRFCNLPALEALLREPACMHVRIIISSTWREAMSLEKLRRLFTPDIAARIVAVTPTLEDGEATRYEEIAAALTAYPDAEWCALDDDAEGFPPAVWYQLVAPDSAIGLSVADVAKLRRIFSAAH